jgi:hypothetical protein
MTVALAAAGEQTETPRCANCGADIPWPPTMHRGATYCCGGCAQGGPCYCSYDLAALDWHPPPGRTAPRHQSRHRAGSEADQCA